MQTLNDALYNLYMSREVALDECLRVSGDPNEFLRMVGSRRWTTAATGRLRRRPRWRAPAAVVAAVAAPAP